MPLEVELGGKVMQDLCYPDYQVRPLGLHFVHSLRDFPELSGGESMHRKALPKLARKSKVLRLSPPPTCIFTTGASPMAYVHFDALNYLWSIMHVIGKVGP